LKRRSTFPCPHCGADVRAGRPACPSCGSDASTGWQDPEELDYQSVDIPDTFEEMEAAYDRGETGMDGATPRWVVATVLLVVVALILVLVWRV